jgi:endonuclease G
VSLDRNQNIFKVPVSTNNLSEVLISRDQYLISYNRKNHLLNWTAWKLEVTDLGHVGRTNNFSADPDLEGYLTQFNEHAVLSTDYQGTCFDRGHQCPSADRTDSVENNSMTFLMSNMTPQTPFLNRGTWEHLERYSRDLVNIQLKKLYIVAGPIFDQDFGNIGPSKNIPIPSKEFKVIFILDKNQSAADINQNTPTIAVVIPNVLDRMALCAPVGSSSSMPADWHKYETTLSEVERISGFVFH